MSGTAIDIRYDRAQYAMCETCCMCNQGDVPVIVVHHPKQHNWDTERKIKVCEACVDHMSLLFET